MHGVFFNDVPARKWTVDGDSSLIGVEVPDKHEHGEGAALTGSVSVTVRTEGGIGNFGGDPQTSNAASFTIS